MFAVKQITVDVPDCPPAPDLGMYIPNAWAFGAAIVGILLLATIVATAIVRYRRHQEITLRQNSARNALVEAAELQRHCPGCGLDLSIEEKLKAVK